MLPQNEQENSNLSNDESTGVMDEVTVHSLQQSAPSSLSFHSGCTTIVGTASEETKADIDNDRSITSPASLPEGGVKAWLVVVAAWCSQFLVFGVVNSTSALQAYISKNQLRDESASSIGFLFSSQLFLTFFLSIYIGPLFDSYGPRSLVAFGSLLTVSSMFLLSICSSYWHFFLAYSVLGGIGGASLSVTSYTTIATFFSNRQGLATGIATTGGSVGGILLPVIQDLLIPKIGWPWTTRVIAFILLGLAVPANLFVRARLPPTKLQVKLIPNMRALKDTKFALCVMGMVLLEWGIFTPDAYITSYTSDRIGSASLGFMTLATMNAAGLLGRIIPGYLADILGPCTVLTMSIILSAVAVLGLWLPAAGSVGMVEAFAVLFGFSSGSNLGLIPVCLLQVSSRASWGGGDSSAAISAAYFISSFGTLSSIPIAGALLEKTGGQYWGMIVFSGASYVVAGAFYAAARILAAGWSLRRAY